MRFIPTVDGRHYANDTAVPVRTIPWGRRWRVTLHNRRLKARTTATATPTPEDNDLIG